MVNKKAVAGAAALTALGVAALALSQREAPPVEEGAPEGEVTIEIKTLGRPKGFSFEDVKGVWGVGATVKVNGKCTAGFPVPTMHLELYDNGAKRKESNITDVTLGTTYTLQDTMAVADVGSHTVYGRMVLTNPLGSYEFTSSSQSFDIGEVPPGEVTLEVTLTPA